MKVKLNIFWYCLVYPIMFAYIVFKAMVHIVTLGRLLKEEWHKEEVFQQDGFLWLPLMFQGYLYWFGRVRLTFSPTFDSNGAHAGHEVTRIQKLVKE